MLIKHKEFLYSLLVTILASFLLILAESFKQQYHSPSPLGFVLYYYFNPIAMIGYSFIIRESKTLTYQLVIIATNIVLTFIIISLYFEPERSILSSFYSYQFLIYAFYFQKLSPNYLLDRLGLCFVTHLFILWGIHYLFVIINTLPNFSNLKPYSPYINLLVLLVEILLMIVSAFIQKKAITSKKKTNLISFINSKNLLCSLLVTLLASIWIILLIKANNLVTDSNTAYLSGSQLFFNIIAMIGYSIAIKNSTTSFQKIYILIANIVLTFIIMRYQFNYTQAYHNTFFMCHFLMYTLYFQKVAFYSFSTKILLFFTIHIFIVAVSILVPIPTYNVLGIANMFNNLEIYNDIYRCICVLLFELLVIIFMKFIQKVLTPKK